MFVVTSTNLRTSETRELCSHRTRELAEACAAYRNDLTRASKMTHSLYRAVWNDGAEPAAEGIDVGAAGTAALRDIADGWRTDNEPAEAVMFARLELENRATANARAWRTALAGPLGALERDEAEAGLARAELEATRMRTLLGRR